MSAVERVIDPLALPPEQRARLDAALARARLADLRPRAVVEPVVFAAACLTALVVLFVRHLGVLPWGASQHGPAVIVVWALGLFGLSLALLAARRAHRLRTLPQGRALTTGEVLDLRGSLVRVIGLEHLEEIREPTDGPIVGESFATPKLCFSDGSFVVFHVDVAQRRAILRDLEETAARLREAHEAHDRAMLERLQLFPDLPPIPAGDGPFRAAPTRERFEPPAPTRTHALVALGVACLSPFAWWGRNVVSDELAFARAQREDDVGAWLAYLEGEPRRAHEAEREHLPFARLRQARRHGNEGLRSFLRVYGHTKAAVEARAELEQRLRRRPPPPSE